MVKGFVLVLEAALNIRFGKERRHFGGPIYVQYTNLCVYSSLYNKRLHRFWNGCIVLNQ